MHNISEPMANFFVVDNGVDKEFFTTINSDGARIFKSVRGVFVSC